MGQLIGIVAQACHLAQQIGMMRTGPGTHLAAHDKCAQIFLSRHPAHRHLFFKVCQLLFVQTQRDHMFALSHRASPLPLLFCRSSTRAGYSYHNGTSFKRSLSQLGTNAA